MINLDQQTFESFIPIFEFAIDKLDGSDKRIYLAKISKALGLYRQNYCGCEFTLLPSATRATNAGHANSAQRS